MATSSKTFNNSSSALAKASSSGSFDELFTWKLPGRYVDRLSWRKCNISRALLIQNKICLRSGTISFKDFNGSISLNKRRIWSYVIFFYFKQIIDLRVGALIPWNRLQFMHDVTWATALKTEFWHLKRELLRFTHVRRLLPVWLEVCKHRKLSSEHTSVFSCSNTSLVE